MTEEEKFATDFMWEWVIPTFKWAIVGALLGWLILNLPIHISIGR